MNPPEAQPDSSLQEAYFDPEAADSSEQYFSASLEARAMRPAFVVNEDDSGDVAPTTSRDADAELPLPAVSGDAELHVTALGCDEEEASPPAELVNGPGETELSDKSPQSDWRDLVSAKVKRYKTANPRKERYPSLQLQFDPQPIWRLDPPSIPDRAAPAATTHSVATQPSYEMEPPVTFEVTTETTARVLEFPRPGMLPFNRDELADPVVDRPRIMEAPEIVPPPPALGGISIEPVREPEPERQPGFDMPLVTAPLSRRFCAVAVDGVVVSAALAVFGYTFLRFNAALPQMRASLVIGVAVFLILWFAYQYAFLTFCATTPGLHAARLRIAHFDGTPVCRRMRRWRVLASILSCVSVGLGYAWCFFDEDELSWHDRMTKTHLAPKQ